ncbi:hypothetical protein [Lentilitoribacter sp. Alg239-R112]|uniref:hypothetical protein n=1 Tax=Lentilitoribacter sp. Alg239-R112 TaxID=2305987 RepID=UPI0013A6B128|nr:hypothetical protein [Lentilitoribacter sp. Alg239-R112]
MTSIFKIILLTGTLVFGASGTKAGNIDGKWFLHEFGELRAYHGDFLNVCSGTGFRSCRTVQYGFKAGDNDRFFGSSRLSIARTLGGGSSGVSGPPQYTIEFFVRNLPDDLKGPITLSIDGKIFQLEDKDWQMGSPEGYNVSETISLINPTQIDELIVAMRKGNSIRFLYEGWKETRFQLRGISNALDAIEKQIKLPSS